METSASNDTKETDRFEEEETVEIKEEEETVEIKEEENPDINTKEAVSDQGDNGEMVTVSNEQMQDLAIDTKGNEKVDIKPNLTDVTNNESMEEEGTTPVAVDESPSSDDEVLASESSSAADEETTENENKSDIPSPVISTDEEDTVEVSVSVDEATDIEAKDNNNQEPNDVAPLDENKNGAKDKALRRRSSSNLMRTSDLEIKDVDAFDPCPANAEAHPTDNWIGLDMPSECHGELTFSPFAPMAMRALAQFGLEAATEENMWEMWNKATRKMASTLAKRAEQGLPLVTESEGGAKDKEVMLWTGKFGHGKYGHDIPAVKARGIVNMSPLALTELLLDSSLVKSYNKNSLGRTEDLVLCNNLQSENVTKVIRSRAKPPLLRKVLEFVSVIHARKLDKSEGFGEGYVIVGRAVEEKDKKQTEGNVVRSEILLNVHLIRKVDNFDGKSEMINVNHLKSPMVPLMIAKKLGSSAAVSFINDIRSLC